MQQLSAACTDAEVQSVARWAAQAAALRSWRAERDGADEPAVWAARMLHEGRLQRLLNTPDVTQEVYSWLPRADITGEPTLELGHVHALRRGPYCCSRRRW